MVTPGCPYLRGVHIFMTPEQAKFQWLGQSMCVMHVERAVARGVWGLGLGGLCQHNLMRA